MSEPVTTPLLGVKVTALCERCGVWHTVEVLPMLDSDLPITKVRPVCWICGERGLPVFQSGRIGHD